VKKYENKNKQKQLQKLKQIKEAIFDVPSSKLKSQLKILK